MRTQFLPAELFFIIFEQLDLATVLQSRGVNREWRSTIDAHCLTWKRYAVHLRLIDKIGSDLPYEHGYKAFDEHVTRNTIRKGALMLVPKYGRGGLFTRSRGVWNGPEAMSLDHRTEPSCLEVPFWLGHSSDTYQRMLVHADLISGRRFERAVRVELEPTPSDPDQSATHEHKGRSCLWKLVNVLSEKSFCCLPCLLGLRSMVQSFQSVERPETSVYQYRARNPGTLEYRNGDYNVNHSWEGGRTEFSLGRGSSFEGLRSLDSADINAFDRLYFLAWPSELRIFLRSEDVSDDVYVTFDGFLSPDYHLVLPSAQPFYPSPPGPDLSCAFQCCSVAGISHGRACVNAPTVVTWSPRPSTPISTELLPASVDTILVCKQLPATSRQSSTEQSAPLPSQKEDSTKFGKIESVAADIRTKTLVLAFDWGLLLFRPFDALIELESKVSVGVVVHFKGEKKKGYQSKCRGLAVYDGRICHSIEHRDDDSPGCRMVKNTIFVIDLDPSRLNPTLDPTELPIDSCQIRMLREEEVYPVVLEHTFEFVGTDIEMDATGIYMREPTHLNYIDFGLAVDHPDTM
ncbi:hypothetical protein IE81DRAFT_350008 [Ceraceosorus guamensis]|uniref:F-box domain-containing protein n=1 Tax=Ceraceosorus guamensis TaxID=1522189 RepID=A0A316VRF4_9BASI|nr:hypothetical protein IE81DRAFT_350008 [Ceraceosorus guamensis]PWN39628.1 hypothetical protein IE81DRAFT_350008 [Ceraceosorus guamensis]